MASAQLVTIDEDRLAGYAEELLQPGGPVEQLAPIHGEPTSTPPPIDREEVARRVLTLNAINFGSGYHDVIDKEPGASGSVTMARRWQRALASWPRPENAAPPSDQAWADVLAELTVEATMEIFGQRRDRADHRELMELFGRSLNDLGRLVADHHDGSFLALVDSSRSSAETLAEHLATLPLYRDEATLDDQVVAFYKRAQITAADLARQLGSAGPVFNDLDQLTAFADNLVPHVLRVDGVLRYEPAVLADIDEARPLVHGSRAEIEIRAAGVEAVERLVAAAADAGRPTRAMDLDLVLWSRGGGSRYKAQRRHRTRCPFY